MVGICPQGTFITEFEGTLPLLYASQYERNTQGMGAWRDSRPLYHQYPSASIYNPIGSLRCSAAAESSDRSLDTRVELTDAHGQPVNSYGSEFGHEEIFPYVGRMWSSNDSSMPSSYKDSNPQRCEGGFDSMKLFYTE